MSISSTTARNDYTGTGALSTWTYSFKIFDKTQLAVTVYSSVTGVETPLTLDVDYTVTGAGSETGGTIVQIFGSAIAVVLPTTSKITIKRNVALTQPAAIKNQGRFAPNTIEDAFDRNVMILQQQQDLESSTMRIPNSEVPTSLNTFLPTIASRALKFLYFDSLGNISASALSIATSAVSSFMAPIILLTTGPAVRLALGSVETRYAVATGAVNTFAITVTPAPTSYVDGDTYTFQANNSNTSSATLNVNGLGAKNIVKKGPSTQEFLVSNDIHLFHPVTVVYDSTLNFFIITSNLFSTDYYVGYGTTVTGNDTYLISSAGPTQTLTTGQTFQFKADVLNTGACTLSVNATGSKALKVIVAGAKVDPPTGTIKAGDFVSVLYDGTDYVVMSIASSVAQRSMVRVNTGNGYGATNTKVRRFTTTVLNTGTAITYADSANNGGLFTINEGGIYSISFTDRVGAGGEQLGISLNSVQGTVGITTVTDSTRLAMTQLQATSWGNVGVTVLLAQGDFIWAHNQAAGTTVNDATVSFTITKVA